MQPYFPSKSYRHPWQVAAMVSLIDTKDYREGIPNGQETKPDPTTFGRNY